MKMGSKMLSLLPVLASALMVGCSSTSTMNYDLQANASNTATVASLPAPTKPINYTLASVAVPESVDQASLVVRQPNDSLMVLSHDKWVASLSQVIQGSLTATLTHELGMPPLPATMTGSTPTEAVASVIVDVQQFEMQPAKQASIRVLWQINFKQTRQPTITCFTTLAQPVAPGVAALVTAQQNNLQALGQQIAAALATGVAPAAANCRVGPV